MRIFDQTTAVLIACLTLGSAAFTPVRTHAADVYSQNVNLTYGQFQEALKAHLDQAMNGLIRREGCAEVAANQYRCGEMPFGRIVDAQKKVVFTIPKQNFKGKKGDVRYEMTGQSIPIYVYRNQKPGEITLSFLDDKKVESRDATARLGDDLFLRLAPGGGKLVQDICMNIPGLRGFAQNVAMNGHLRKNMPWPLPDVKAKLKVKVGVGQFDFDGAKICMSLLTEMDERGLPLVTLRQISEPSFKGFTHQGLKVNASADVGGFWGFINGFLKWFGYDLEKIIAGEVQKAVKAQAAKEIKVTLQDVRSGKWFREYVNHAQVAKLVKGLSDRLRAEMRRQGFGRTQVEQAAQAACLAAVTRMGLGAAETKDLLALCLLAPKIQLEYFLNDRENRERGCYSHFWDIRRVKDGRGERRWYLDRCELVNRVRVSVDPQVTPLMKCLLRALSEHQDPLKACERELTDFENLYERGDLDDLIAKLKDVKPVRPSVEQLEMLRRVAQQSLGIRLPPADELLKLWP